MKMPKSLILLTQSLLLFTALLLTPTFIIPKTNESIKNKNNSQTCYCDFCDELRATSSIKTEKRKQSLATTQKRKNL